MKLDKHYNIKDQNADIYKDSFDEIVDLVIDAKKNGSITDKEAAIILSIAIRKQNKNEVRGFIDMLLNKGTEKHTLFIQLKTNHSQYA